MFNISVRRQRFLKMWAKQFTIAMAWAIGVLIAASAFTLFLMWFAIIFGMKVFGAVMIGLVIMGIVATFAGMKAEEKLLILEREEQKTMDALKKESDPEVVSFRSQSPFIPQYIPKVPAGKTPLYGKYLDMIYGTDKGKKNGL